MSAISNTNIGAVPKQLMPSILEENRTATITMCLLENNRFRVIDISIDICGNSHISTKLEMSEVVDLFKKRGCGFKSI